MVALQEKPANKNAQKVERFTTLSDTGNVLARTADLL